MLGASCTCKLPLVSCFTYTLMQGMLTAHDHMLHKGD